jgi:uncharacterized phage protein gp47/JayE
MLPLQNFTTMVQNMAAAVQGACSTLVDLTVGSAIRAMLEAVAGIALWLQFLVLLVLQATRLATSSGSQCDTFGADFGFTRLPATAATGTVTFARFTATNSALVPIGAQVRTADGTETFNVVVDTTNTYYSASLAGYLIPSGTSSVSVAVIAAVAGSGGNVVAGAINLIAGTIPFIDTVNNAVAFTNGENAETDTAFKARFINYINTRSQATPAAVLYAATSISQNITASIDEFYNPAGVYTPGSFTLYADDGSGAPPSTTLSTISAAVNASRALGIAYAVQGPSEIVANISFTLSVSTGIVKANIIAGVQSAVADYIGALPMGSSLPYSRLLQVIYDSSVGISNVTSLLVNGGTADLGGGSSQVVRAGTITVS